MNPFIKKEIRLILPGFLICCGLTLTNLLTPESANGSFGYFFGLLPFLFCPFMVVILALNSFGGEISSGNFSMLLAQPVPRQKIWEKKILLLALSLLFIGVFYAATAILRDVIRGDYQIFYHWDNFLFPIGTFMLIVYSGALWTVLLLRQVAAAFWFTVLVPGVIWVTLQGLFAGQSDEFLNIAVVGVLGLYSLGGLFLARWLFMRAQDVAWSGGSIAMPEMRGSPAWLTRLTAWRAGSPRGALWRKEFQLQQSQFIMAFALAVLQLGDLATRDWGHFRRNSDMEFILESFWFLWLVMPFMVGCTAVAEERKLETHQNQLCLPVKRRTQFTIKLLVVLFLSILMGAGMPLLFEGGRILPNAHIHFLNAYNGQFLELMRKHFFWHCLEVFNQCWPLLLFLGIAAGIGLISFFVSTLSRNTLQALAPALTFIVLFGFMIQLERISVFNRYPYPLWQGDLIYLIGLPILSATVVILAYRNFQNQTLGWKLWLKNLLTLFASLGLIAVLTTAIYHRVWEKLTPFEPAHGPARLALSNPATMSQSYNDHFVRLPDGRIWMDSVVFATIAPFGEMMIGRGSGSFFPGTDWAMVERLDWEYIGIKDDGTLWVSPRPLPYQPHPTRASLDAAENALRQLMQFGTATNWKNAEPYYPSALLTKTDGTLWRWGPDHFSGHWTNWPGLATVAPEQLGAETNWDRAFQSMGHLYLAKTDGSIWIQAGYGEQEQPQVKLGRDFSIQLLSPSTNHSWRSMVGIHYWVGFNLGVRDDGTLRIWADEGLHPVKIPATPKHSNVEYELVWMPVDLQFGTCTNWLAAASDSEHAVTLKDDGTLWLWRFGLNPRVPLYASDGRLDLNQLKTTIPTRLGIHSDWIAIASGQGYFLSLAADGSLWYWPTEEPRFYGGEDQFEPLLDISHKPKYLGNIFSETSTNR